MTQHNKPYPPPMKVPPESAAGRWLGEMLESNADSKFHKHLLFMYVVLRIPLMDCLHMADAMRDEDLTLDEACYIAGHWEVA